MWCASSTAVVRPVTLGKTTPPDKEVVYPASHKHHEAVGHAPASRPSTPPAAEAANARVVASSVNAVALRHAKLCLEPNGLVRKGRFGDMDLFERMLEEQVGFADVNPLHGLYAEHCISTDSHAACSPPNNPSLVHARGRVLFRRGRRRRGQEHVGAQALGAV